MMKPIHKQALWLALLMLVIFSTASCQSTRTEQVVGEGYILERDMVYGTAGDVELLLDLARPDAGKGPYPALMFLFGGGYSAGNKSFFRSEIQEAAKRGYVGVAVNYRLTEEKAEDGQSKYQFPAQLHDAKCAVRWLRENSRKYRIDQHHVGALGYSAGGNLALMLGLTDPSDGLEGDCGEAQVSSRVQAVVSLAGATDMVLTYTAYRAVLRRFLGGSLEEVPERYRAASPVTYVTPDDPPVLSICGAWDSVLPQAELLDERMRAVGASHELIVEEGVGHDMYKLFDPYQDNAVWDFLDRHLKQGE